MDQKVIEHYLSEVPSEIRDALKPLCNDKAWAIYIALLEEDKRFSEIKRLFNTESSEEIDRILKSLVTGGLISKKAKPAKDLLSPDRVEKTYYGVTKIGKELISALYDAFIPPLKPSESEMAMGMFGLAMRGSLASMGEENRPDLMFHHFNQPLVVNAKTFRSLSGGRTFPGAVEYKGRIEIKTMKGVNCGIGKR